MSKFLIIIISLTNWFPTSVLFKLEIAFPAGSNLNFAKTPGFSFSCMGSNQTCLLRQPLRYVCLTNLTIF